MSLPSSDGQYAINGFVFGKGTNSLYVQNTAVQVANASVQDSTLVNDDATLYGIDAVPNVTITFTGFARADTPLDTLAAYDQFAALWSNPLIRLVNSSVSELVCWYPYSSEQRVVWGRGRLITPTMGMANQCVIPFVATFQTVSPYFYTYQAQTLDLDEFVQLGPLTTPLTTPVTGGLQPQSVNKQEIVNTGLLPTWPIIEIFGPVQNPVLNFIGLGKTLGYNGILRHRQSLTIDCRPWWRTILRDDGVSQAGQLSGSAKLSDLLLPPGSTRVTFAGTRISVGLATSFHCQITWRKANASIGG